MTSIKKLTQEIEAIKKRNARVESHKAWETSWTRKSTVAVLTYFVVLTFFLIANLPNPFVNALIPALAFILSTLSLSIVRSFWQKRVYKK